MGCARTVLPTGMMWPVLVLAAGMFGAQHLGASAGMMARSGRYQGVILGGRMAWCGAIIPMEYRLGATAWRAWMTRGRINGMMGTHQMSVMQ